MRKKLYVTGAVIVIAVVAIIWQRIKSSEDEDEPNDGIASVK